MLQKLTSRWRCEYCSRWHLFKLLMLLPQSTVAVPNYFEDTWIGRPQRRNRRWTLLFQHSLGNSYDSVNTGLLNTNKAQDSWHRGFAELLSCNHQTTWKSPRRRRRNKSRRPVHRTVYCRSATVFWSEKILRLLNADCVTLFVITLDEVWVMTARPSQHAHIFMDCCPQFNSFSLMVFSLSWLIYDLHATST